jgi:hypothetical protein
MITLQEGEGRNILGNTPFTFALCHLPFALLFLPGVTLPG